MEKYKTIETWTKAMQKDKAKKLHADWYNIGGHWYVMEEFDDSGKYMRYTSLTAWKHIDVKTSNRYSDNWLSDMTATSYPIEYLRFNVAHYIDSETSNKELLAILPRLDITQARQLLDFILTK